MQLSRRRFLEVLGPVAALGGVSLIAACQTPSPPAPAQPTTAPSGGAAAASPAAAGSALPVAKPAPSPAASAASPAASPVAVPAASPAVAASPSPAAAAPIAGKPQYQVDAARTGRSPHAGPRQLTLRRSFDTGQPQFIPADAAIPRPDIQSSSAIDPSGTIYIANFAAGLFALRDGSAPNALDLVWHFVPSGGASSLHATPAIGRDGTVYLGFSAGPAQQPKGTLYALKAPASGTEPQVVWTLDMGDGRITASPLLGPDGTIYLNSGSGTLFAVGPDGKTRWTVQTGPSIKASAALGPDGTVYQPSADGKLYALSPPSGGGTQGTVKWSFDFGQHLGPTPLMTAEGGFGGNNGVGSGSTPAIGPDGTIYIGANNSNFYAIAPDGSQKWLFEAEREIAGIWSAACLSADSSVLYFGANKGGVYALNARDGSKKWQFPVYGSIYASPALDRQGLLYVATTVEHVFAIDTATGEPIADYDAGAQVWTAPSIRPDGTLVVADRNGKVLVLG
jgi:outer membrane protein assembly factor BamB